MDHHHYHRHHVTSPQTTYPRQGNGQRVVVEQLQHQPFSRDRHHQHHQPQHQHRHYYPYQSPYQSPYLNSDMADDQRAAEREPLLGTAPGTNGVRAVSTGAGPPHNGDDDQQAKARKRRRWISLAASVILIIGFVGVLILSGILSRRKQDNGGKEKPPMNNTVCLTPACVHAASEVLYNLSPNYKNIDACTNFDQLVCDGFHDRHDIPSDRGSYSTGTLMSETGQTTLRHILEGVYPQNSQHSTFSPMNLAMMAASTDEQNFNTMTLAYSTCMNETAIKELGAKPLVNLISQVSDSFPVDDSHEGPVTLGHSDVTSLSNTILLLEKWGITTFEGLGTGADDENPEVVIIQASPAGITLPSPEYYQDKDIVQKYESTVKDVFTELLPSSGSRKRAEKLAKSVVDLEKSIAAVTPPPEDQQDVTKYYNIVKVADAAKIGPMVGLDSVIKGLVPSSYTADTMLLAFPEFLGNVSQILSSSTRETVQAYFVWRVVASHYNHVQASEVEPVRRFFNVLGGRDPDTKSERWKVCLGAVDSQVGWILSRFFIEAAFSEEAKKFGDEIIMDIKHQFISKLHGLSWMDDSVKELAVNKVNLIDQKIGYPTKSPNIMDPDALKEYYRNLPISDSFFGNWVAANGFDVTKTWSALGKPVDHGEWLMLADTVNAYYNPVGAEIVFPAAIMQFPVFEVDLPSYISYGAFASVAGHELSHAFDSSGRHYDEHGKFTDWWTNHTVEEFQKRADCFVDQYSNFTVSGPAGEPLHVNGRLTLGENIADAGGIAAAFKAWKERQGSHPDQDLPGLEHFTQEQLFFVFYGNWWCGKVRKEQAIQYIYTDPHSPAWARILGTTANSRAFREAFNCPVKEPTCELW